MSKIQQWRERYSTLQTRISELQARADELFSSLVDNETGKEADKRNAELLLVRQQIGIAREQLNRHTLNEAAAKVEDAEEQLERAKTVRDKEAAAFAEIEAEYLPVLERFKEAERRMKAAEQGVNNMVALRANARLELAEVEERRRRKAVQVSKRQNVPGVIWVD